MSSRHEQKSPAEHAMIAADYFRIGCEADAGEHLTALIDGIHNVLAILTPEKLTVLQEGLAPLLDAQERKDFSCAADMLQYHLAPLLASTCLH